MLVLTREEGQTFYIGEDIEITVGCIDNNQVRINIQAPKDVAIMRKELTGDFVSKTKNKSDLTVLKEKIDQKASSY